MQIDHVSIPVTDLAAATAFYEQALAPLGVQIVAEFPSGIALGGGQGQGIVGLRQGTEYPGPVHVALSTDRAGVDAFYRLRSQRAALTTAPRASDLTSRTTTPPTSGIQTGTTSKLSAARRKSRTLTALAGTERRNDTQQTSPTGPFLRVSCSPRGAGKSASRCS
jgi:catechol 2,3-dioxygenase-like lactoylglutathione lyase family enzyme